MAGIKELKNRIKSISGTRKVTRAMQMVSAAKMRKSQDATMKSRSYASLAWELITNLSGVIQESGEKPTDIRNAEMSNELDPGYFDSPQNSGITQLLKTFPKATKIAILILSTNKGLVGSLNTNLLAMAQKTIQSEVQRLSSEGADFITYGRKGREWTARSQKEILADFEKFDRTISTEDIFPISELITKLYASGNYQKVLIIYNHYVSTLVQKPTVKQLLPFVKTPVESSVSSLKSIDQRLTTNDYLFEPTPQEVLNHLLPRIIESQIYQTILESEASEQSARMVMMKNATEAAGDLISDLTLTFNKLRQNKITTELAEITAGKIALE